MSKPERVGSTVQTAIGRLSKESTGPVASLHLVKPAIKKFLLDQPRDVELLDKALRGLMNRMCKKELPWPLTIIGERGRGKTCATLCLLDLAGGEYFTAEELNEKHNAAKFGRYEEALKSGGHWKPSAEGFRYHKIQWPALVVVDDIGVRGVASPALYETLKYVLDLRHARPLIVVSNLGLDELEKCYDARVTSRLGEGTIFHLEGPDRRLA